MWSEHCSYKSSRVHLARLHTTGPQVAIGPGENAGAVRIGEGLCAIFKMESHNHPSYIEPYQGAATGVGGILRDVFTMGARPIAAMNALRFGRWEHPKTRHLLNGVVAGIGGYGNCFGVPTVGGNLSFHPAYDGNCLVNAFALGIAAEDRIFLGTASGVGNPVLYVGAKTGRDGIHGATMASDVFDDATVDNRPTVQVGDPFREKLLLEACLELMQEECIVGIQDMGAAGLTSASVEMASRGGTGLVLQLDRVPARETDMTPYDFLLSESQERMLLVAKPGMEPRVAEVFAKWDLEAIVIGRVTDDSVWRCTWHGDEVCALPVGLLADDAPKYHRPCERPESLTAQQVVPEVSCTDAGVDLLALLASPDGCHRGWVWQQYDHEVGAGTVAGPGGDAAVVEVPDTDIRLAMTVDCNARHVLLEPKVGALGVIAEAARNLACVGATPLAATDCLNFGSPERPDVAWQLSESVDGLTIGCKAFDLPIISGNVSLYNASAGSAILPTPMVGAVGKLAPGVVVPRSDFTGAGMTVAVLGQAPSHGVGASQWLTHTIGRDAGTPPPVDIDGENALHTAVRTLIAEGLVTTVHDVFEGGVAIALAECCMSETVGLVGTTPGGGDVAGRLFGEDHGRVIVAWNHSDDAAIQHVCGDIPVHRVGTTGGDRLALDGVLNVKVSALRLAHRNALRTFAEDLHAVSG
jgi:phosphoribosylformylglycinamidine synthase II